MKGVIWLTEWRERKPFNGHEWEAFETKAAAMRALNSGPRRGPWADVYKAPVTVMEATARTVRRKQRPPHTGHIEAGSYASEDGGPKLMRSVVYARSCHGYADHPTQKPTAVLRPLIEYSCPPGGLVLDPFAGSGSTGVAAQELERNYMLIEIHEDYHAAAERRLSQIPLVFSSSRPTEGTSE